MPACTPLSANSLPQFQGKDVHRQLSRFIRSETNDGVDLIRRLMDVRKIGSKTLIAKVDRQLRSLGLDPETVDGLSDDELKPRLNARLPPWLR